MELPEQLEEYGSSIKLIYVFVQNSGSATVDQLRDKLKMPLTSVLGLVGYMLDEGLIEKVEPSSCFRVTVSA